MLSDLSSTILCTQKLLRTITWHGDSCHSNLATQNFTSEITAAHNTCVNLCALETVGQNDNRFNVNGIGHGTFDSMSPDDAFDQVTFNGTFYTEDYPAWS